MRRGAFLTNVRDAVAAHAAFAAVAQPGAVHDVLIQLGGRRSGTGEFVPGLDPWTWHATFEALYARADAVVTLPQRRQRCCHEKGIVQTLGNDGGGGWYHVSTVDGFVHTHALPGGALPHMFACVMVRAECAYPASAHGRLELDWPSAMPARGLEERTVRSVRIGNSPWRIDFAQAFTHWPLMPAVLEVYDVTLVWDPPPSPASPDPEPMLAIVQTAVAASEAELRAAIYENMTAFERHQLGGCAP